MPGRRGRTGLKGERFHENHETSGLDGSGRCGPGVGSKAPPKTIPPSLSDLTQDAADAAKDAETARKDAEKAKADADKYAGMLGVTHSSVNGDSMKAANNAQTALDKAMAVFGFSPRPSIRKERDTNAWSFDYELQPRRVLLRPTTLTQMAETAG